MIDLNDNINPENTGILNNACKESNKLQEDKEEKMTDDNKQTNNESKDTRKSEQSFLESRIQELQDEKTELKTRILMLEKERTELIEEKAELASNKANLQRQLELNQSEPQRKESERNLDFFKEECDKLTKEKENLKILLATERLKCDKLVKDKLEVINRLAESDRRVTLQHNKVILPALT